MYTLYLPNPTTTLNVLHWISREGCEYPHSSLDRVTGLRPLSTTPTISRAAFYAIAASNHTTSKTLGV